VLPVSLRAEGPVEPLDRKVIGLAAVGGGGLLLAGAYQMSGGRIGVPCVFHATTGLDCPLCGSTRMAAALLRGDPAAAWAFNAPMLLIGPVVGVAVGYQLLAWSMERVRLVRLPRWRLRASTQDRLIKVFAVGMLLFGVLRNL
jgi:Protein of unknown function (DUF2752)